MSEKEPRKPSYTGLARRLNRISPEHKKVAIEMTANLAGVPGLEVEVVVVGLRPKLDLFELGGLLVLLGLAVALGRLVLELPVVHDLAHRGHGLRVDFNQLKTELIGAGHGFVGGHDAKLLALVVDDPHLFYADAATDAMGLYARLGFGLSAADGLTPSRDGAPDR